MASRVEHGSTSCAAERTAAAGIRTGRSYEVELKHKVGALSLDVRFTLSAPWTVLFAPSGAGKTTVLRLLAGLERPLSGRIVTRGLPSGVVDQEVLLDSSERHFVPAHRRRIHMVMQSPALFPHRSVLGNVAFGLEAEPGARAQAQEAVRLCRVDHLGQKMPAQLSGGESQRVALARAIAGLGFRLLLLDEPFTGLEADLRDAILFDLRKHLARRGIPVLQVTHDVGEVFAAEAEVLRMEAGRIVAQGPAEVVLERERRTLLARLQRGT